MSFSQRLQTGGDLLPSERGTFRRLYHSKSATATSAAFLVLVVILAILLATRGGSDNATAPVTTLPGQPAPAARPFDDVQSIPWAGTLHGIRWDVYAGVAVPSGDLYGPRVLDGPVPQSWAQSAAGALLADVQIAARLSVAPPGDWQRLVAADVAPGPGRDAYSVIRSHADESPSVVGTEPCQLAGYVFAAYDPRVQASISSAYRCPDGLIQSTTSTVKWMDGPGGPGWRLVLLDTGDQSPPAVSLPDLTGYTPFSADAAGEN